MKITGKFTYLMIELGHLRWMRYAPAGASAPARKKNTRPLRPEKREREARERHGPRDHWHEWGSEKMRSDVLVYLTL